MLVLQTPVGSTGPPTASPSPSPAPLSLTQRHFMAPRVPASTPLAPLLKLPWGPHTQPAVQEPKALGTGAVGVFASVLQRSVSHVPQKGSSRA